MDLLLPDSSFMLIALAIGLCNLALLVTALVMLLRNNTMDSNTKLMWTLIIIFVPTIGSILYFVFYATQRKPDNTIGIEKSNI